MLGKIKQLPPLVTPSEVSSLIIQRISQSLIVLQIERLRHQLSAVQQNKAFLLHAGDCAESFDACTHVRLFSDPKVRHCVLTNLAGEYLEQDRSHSVLLPHSHLGSEITNCGSKYVD